MLVRCPECRTEFRLVDFEGDERVVSYYCRDCDRIVRVDLELDEVPSSSSSGSYRDRERRRTVLVADDLPGARERAQELLTEAGYHVIVASDGLEALRMIRDYHPDLVVLDLLMPGMSGFDVLREIARDERLQDIPVLAVSGVVPDDPAPFLRRGAASRLLERERLPDRLVAETRSLLGDDAPPA